MTYYAQNTELRETEKDKTKKLSIEIKKKNQESL